MGTLILNFKLTLINNNSRFFDYDLENLILPKFFIVFFRKNMNRFTTDESHISSKKNEV